jgi:hypothetical protein
MEGVIGIRLREAKFSPQRTSAIAFHILPTAMKRTSMIFSLSIIPGDSKFFLVDAKLSHLGTKLSYVDPKLSHPGTKLSYVEARFSPLEAKFSHVLRSLIESSAPGITKPGLNTFKKSLANTWNTISIIFLRWLNYRSIAAIL